MTQELHVLVFILLLKTSYVHCNWGALGGWGLGNNYNGYNNNNGYGYGTNIYGGGRRHNYYQYQPQQRYPTYGDYNNNNQAYYQDPVPVRSTIQQPQINTAEQNPSIQVTVAPQTTTSTTTAPVYCSQPHARDTTVFHQTCIFPDEVAQNPCSSRGSYIPTGTSAITACKSPEYYSENGEMILETCKNGLWYSDGKKLVCASKARKPHDPTPAPPPRSDHYVHEHHQNHHPNIRNQSSHSDPVYFPSWSHNDTVNNYTQTPGWSWTPPITTTTTTPPPFWAWTPPTIPTTTTPAWTQPTTTRPFWAWTHPTTTRPTWAWTPWTTTSTTETTTTTTTPTTTTPTPTTITTTTTKTPYIWDIDDRTLETRCPSLSKNVGVQLQCTSKVPLPWSPSSFVVTEDQCESPQHVGSEATYKCSQYYEATSALKTMYRKCKEGGTWTGSAEMFACTLECGVPNANGNTVPLISFGEPTYRSQWPWHAALFLKKNRNDQTFQYICGGTLISKGTLLTAAHCVSKMGSATTREVSLFRIDLGRYERTVDDEFVQTFSAEEIIVHPDYNPNSYDSDIAIIVLKEAVSIGFHVRPICYPQQQNAAFEDMHLASGSVGTVVGFGKNELDVEADTLQQARLKVISTKECALSYSDTTFGLTLAKSTTFCAGNGNKTNVCSGDSGSGIYFSSTTIQGPRWYLRGLVSVGVQTQEEGGTRKCDPTRYSIFTKISPYADWISRQLSTLDYNSFV